MADITSGQEAVLRSFVGQQEALSDLQEAYDRLGNFDEVVLEILNKQLAIFVSDGPGVIVVDGITINNTENIRALRDTIRNFQNTGGTGLETTQTLGVQIAPIRRPDHR